MIRQRQVTIKTANATLTVSEMGDIICNSTTDITLTLPTGSDGLWFYINNINTGKVAISNGAIMTKLSVNESAMVLFNTSNSSWCYTKGGGADKTIVMADWDTEVTYNTNDWCMYNGKLYKSMQDSNLNKNPSTATTYWSELSGGGSGGVEKSYGTASIPITGWDVLEGSIFAYKKDVAIPNVYADMMVYVAFDKEKLSISYTAGIVSGDSYDGGITFYAMSIPTQSIDFTYSVF